MTSGTSLYNISVEMGAYDYEVQFYEDDLLLDSAFLRSGGSFYKLFDEHTAFNGEIQITYPNGGNASSFTNLSNNAYLDGTTVVPAKLEVGNVQCDVNLTVSTIAFDHIVDFYDQNAMLLSTQYVADGGSAAYSAGANAYISAADTEVVNNDGLTGLTNSLSEGWGSVRIDNVDESKAVTLTINPYVTKVLWVQGDPAISSTIHYFGSAVSSDTITPIDGYVFGNEFSLATSNGGSGSASYALSQFTLNITAQGDFDVTLQLNPYDYRVQFINSVTGEVEKTVYADENGFDVANPGELPYFRYGLSAKTLLSGVTVTGATINEAADIDFNGTVQAIWERVEVTSFTEQNAVVTFTPAAFAHRVTINYTDPWNENIVETVYTSGDVFTKTVTDMKIVTVDSNEATVTAQDDTSFTLSIPEGTNPTVYVDFKHVGTRLTLSNFVNKTKNNATISIIDSIDSYYGIFTVTCSNACLIAYENPDGSYTKLTAHLVEGNTYQFECPANFSPDISITVAIKGDTNGDGKLDPRDVTRLQRALLETSHSKYLPFDDIFSVMIADINEDNKNDPRDVTRLQRALLESSHSKYLAFAW